MQLLFKIVFANLTIGGALFLGALFTSTMSIAEKVVAGVAMVFLATTLYFLMIIHLACIESFRLLIEHLSKVAPKEIQWESNRILQYLDETMAGNIRMTRVGRLGYLLLGIFAFWFVGGILVYVIFR